MSFYPGLRLVRQGRLQGISEGCSWALVGIRPASVVRPRKDCRCVPSRYDKSGAGPQGKAPLTFDMTHSLSIVGRGEVPRFQRRFYEFMKGMLTMVACAQQRLLLLDSNIIY